MIFSDAALPMALFALATSATPGTVNVLSAMSGARFGIWLSLPYVLGATTSFVAILVGLGMGLQAILNLIERFSLAMSLSGAAYMLYLAWRIAADSGDLCFEKMQRPRPGFATGLVTQALNPKAWIVSLSAITIYVAPHGDYMVRLATFSAIFYLICAASLATWVVVGAQVARFSGNVALFNRVMAGLLALSVIVILIEALPTR